MTTNHQAQLPINAFADKTLDWEQIMTPEKLTEDQRTWKRKTAQFVEEEARPVLHQIENQQFEPVYGLMKKLGSMGLLGAFIPAEHGGTAIDKVAYTAVIEEMGGARSFSVSYGAQVGIGSLPIVYYGTEKQKAAYLPKIASGDMIGSYGLTEPGAGTDIAAVQTTAEASEDESVYTLSGEKQWITNSSFSSYFIIFAKIDGKKPTAFIVDRNTEGFTIGQEEDKMGITGSSTCPLYLDNVKVPKEAIVGEIGKGARIALSILNLGRQKIAASCVGASKRALLLSAEHAQERRQFGHPLSEKKMIQKKLAAMAVWTFASESMVYRTAGVLQTGTEAAESAGIPFADILKNFAIECSINKIFASEALSDIVDHGVQVHGGQGYMRKNEIETLYRDSRINRIFEGTNEINRVVVASMLFEMAEEMAAKKETTASAAGILNKERTYMEKLRELLAELVKETASVFEAPEEEQELLECVAETAKSVYVMESVWSRVQKDSEADGLMTKMASVYMNEAVDRVLPLLKEAADFLESESMLQQIKQLAADKSAETDHSITYRRNIAEAVIEHNGYPLS